MIEQTYTNKSTWQTASKSYGWTAYHVSGERTQPDGGSFETYKDAEAYAIAGSKCIKREVGEDGLEYEATRWGWQLKEVKKEVNTQGYGGSTRAPSRTDRDLYHKTFALLMLIALTLPALGWEPAEAPEHYARALTAAVILAEAKGESPQGRQAVYEVIWTRVSETESNYIKVLTKRKQFSCLNGVKPNDLIAKERKHPLWWAVYSGLLKFPPLTTWTVPKGLPKTNRHRANHYYAHRTVKPYWSNGNGVRIGNHTFERH